jgi:spore coat protein U-like protein
VKFLNAVKFALSAAIVGFLALGPASIPAGATTATSTFLVTATVASICTISTTPLAFGSYTGAISQVNTTVTVTCTNTTPYNLGLNAGLATGATVTTRSMTGPASALLSYQLFRDAGHTLNWGVTIGTDTVPLTGNGAAQVETVYGQILAGQFVTPGSYADTITATVTY